MGSPELTLIDILALLSSPNSSLSSSGTFLPTPERELLFLSIESWLPVLICLAIRIEWSKAVVTCLVDVLRRPDNGWSSFCEEFD